MRSIGFLHTSPVHVATFDALLAAAGSGARAQHVVDESLLADARKVGVDGVRERLAERLAEAARGADVVCCTCSTLGAAAEALGSGGVGDMSVPVVRVDRPMARRAVELGERVAVIASVASTVAPSREVLLDEGARAGRAVQIDTHVIEDAWEAFTAGDLTGYARQVADACRRAAREADVIVLAQASMAGAIEELTDLAVPVLGSPALAVEWLLANDGEVTVGR